MSTETIPQITALRAGDLTIDHLGHYIEARKTVAGQLIRFSRQGAQLKLVFGPGDRPDYLDCEPEDEILILNARSAETPLHHWGMQS